MGSRKVNDFKFKQFAITQQRSAMRVNTDGVLLGAWAELSAAHRILDIGTGTGVIALMAAQRNHNAKVTGLEVHRGSFADAKVNADRSKFANQVEMLHLSLQDFEQGSPGLFDHLISNPPYFQSGTRSANDVRAAVRHTDSLSFGELVYCSLSLLTEGGKLSLILPSDEGALFIDQANAAGLQLERCCHVYINEHTIGRLLMTFVKGCYDGEVPQEQILIRKEDGDYSEAYKKLTKDFYLNF